MKFIINSLLFSKQIQSLSGVLTNNNTVPIINCFHFHLDEGLLTIRATDLETTLVSKVEVETGTIDGLTDIAVPSKLLIDILKSFPDFIHGFFNFATGLYNLTGNKDEFKGFGKRRFVQMNGN